MRDMSSQNANPAFKTLDYLKHMLDAARGRRHPFVLCYHGVSRGPLPSDPRGLFVTSAQFEEHVEFIQARGYELVSVSELWRLMRSGVDMSHHASITFDDGLASTMHEAMPILARHDAGCTMFVATGLLGRMHPHMRSQPIMTREEVLELDAAGMEVGAHTVDHARLTEIPYAEVLSQLRDSRAFLEDLLGRPMRVMAYPFGAFDQQTIRAAEATGYEIACGCKGPAPWRPLSLPREPIFPTITDLRLRLKMAGLFGPVHASKGIRTALRSVRRPGPAPS
jgi:peptidoglycan/xylan/chitin deacetylase (PgdA/CDA1 family)